MKRLALASLLLLATLSASMAQQAVVVPATMASTAISVASATTTRLVTGISGKSIYVTQWNALSGGTGNITWVAGTGATCGTSQVSLTGPYNLTAQVGAVVGTGYGAVLVVPQGYSLCIITSAAVQISGSVGYAIF